ncbi:MAG: DNA repair protein RecN [Pseudomonadota bacterium]
MLRGLDISNMLIIDRLELAFQPGLNVLTGETGAGKSILLDALGFVLGWRGRADLVRQGAEQGEVTAWFDITQDHPAQAVLDAAGLPGGEELILRRINTQDGRKTAWVNDRRCSGDILRALSDCLIELHGQQDDRGLLNPRGHRDILDDFGDLSALRSDVRAAWRAQRLARQALEENETALTALRAEEDYIRHAVAELETLAPLQGEEEELDQRRRLMQSAEKIRADVIRAHEALGNQGAEAAMSNALRWLEDATPHAEASLAPAVAALGRALAELDEAVGGVLRTIEGLTFNPIELEETEERLFEIRALSRKHSVQADDLPKLADQLRQRLDALDSGTGHIASLQNDLSKAEKTYQSAAGRLRKARAVTAQRLDKAVSEELAPLKMERAVFKTVLSEEAAGPEGIDCVAFRVSTNPGAPAGPLNKIASGGELSRFLLAIKVCLTRGQPGLTMIFDEIDRGVGGATADAVGRRLAAIAEAGQVLVVTHSPQVAALGAHHWRVEKTVAKGITTSTVTELPSPDRVDEIARMLSGDTITEEARGAARALLAG